MKFNLTRQKAFNIAETIESAIMQVKELQQVRTTEVHIVNPNSDCFACQFKLTHCSLQSAPSSKRSPIPSSSSMTTAHHDPSLTHPSFTPSQRTPQLCISKQQQALQPWTLARNQTNALGITVQIQTCSMSWLLQAWTHQIHVPVSY